MIGQNENVEVMLVGDVYEELSKRNVGYLIY